MERIKDILSDELGKLKDVIIEHHESAGQVASGRTKQSLMVDASDSYGILWGRSYFGSLETGRRGGGMPYAGIIKQWAIDKGLKFENDRELTSFSFAVARKIANEGTKLYRQGGRADIYSNAIPATMENVADRIMDVFAIEVESININSVENETAER